HLLELHHAGVGEEQARVVLRHQRGARHDGVPALLEEIQERLADLIPPHCRSCNGSRWRQPPRGGGRVARPGGGPRRLSPGRPRPRGPSRGRLPPRDERPARRARAGWEGRSLPTHAWVLCMGVCYSEAQTCSLVTFFLDSPGRNGLRKCRGGTPRRCSGGEEE